MMPFSYFFLMGNSTNSTENLLPVYQYLKIFTGEIKAQFHSQNKTFLLQQAIHHVIYLH